MLVYWFAGWLACWLPGWLPACLCVYPSMLSEHVVWFFLSFCLCLSICLCLNLAKFCDANPQSIIYFSSCLSFCLPDCVSVSFVCPFVGAAPKSRPRSQKRNILRMKSQFCFEGNNKPICEINAVLILFEEKCVGLFGTLQQYVPVCLSVCVSSLTHLCLPICIFISI